MRSKIGFCCLWFVWLAGGISAIADAPKADTTHQTVPARIDGQMMKRYLLKCAQQQSENWRDRYEQLKTPEQIEAYQRILRERFLDAIGRLPERTPLHPQITGVVQRAGYRVEKVIYQSQPNFYVTAAMFVPQAETFKPPYPAVLICCGHDDSAKLYHEYQTMAALLALNGMAALIVDPIDQGERAQSLEHWKDVRSIFGHTMVGIGSILLGQNTARFELWDNMRGIDYLQSRDDILPDRIGVTGHSGGGTQTSYLMSLDDRIKAAAPSCYITDFDRLLPTSGPQDAEQNIYGQLAFGMRHADYLMMRAPMPVLICAATQDFFDIEGTWNSFRYAKRLFTRLGYAERIDLIEHDAPHSYEKPHREAVARWMSRWLRGKDEPITEPAIELLSQEEMQCAPQGQVMLIKGARSAYDLNRDTEKQFAAQRQTLWATADKTELLDNVRQIAGIRKLPELPKPKVQELDMVKREGYSLQNLILTPEEGIHLPAILFVPNERNADNAVLYLHEKGKEADVDGVIRDRVNAGQMVLAVDVRGTGQTQQTQPSWTTYFFGVDGPDVFLAYLLGKSYVGMRTEDILICARWLRDHELTGQNGQVSLMATGLVAVPTLHAAALESEMFDRVELSHMLVSWSNVIGSGQSRNQIVNIVHGSLTAYDLDNLASVLGAKLVVHNPLNAMGQPITE